MALILCPPQTFADMDAMRPSHFIASLRDDGGGCTWTLTTRLGQMLSRAESLYGPRDSSWTILGVEFAPNPPPMIWYPGNCKHIAIRLAPNALNSEAVALYQLAHECIHLLAPTGSNKANVLEEGVATAFAEDFVSAPQFTREVSYIRAAAVVRELLVSEPDAIPRLRRVEPYFYRMTPQTFSVAGLQSPASVVSELLSTFERGES
jgi:hypothetical protein